MQERSEEQIISRLFELENEGHAAERAELTGQRFLSLIQDPTDGRGYVFQHGLDETEGAHGQPLEEDRQGGELVETDSEEALATPSPTEPRSAIATRRPTRIRLS